MSSDHPLVVSTLLRLLEIPSPSGAEGPICDLVEREVAAAASAGQPVTWDRHGDALVVRGARRAGFKHLVLVGHLDTVPIVEGLHPPRHDGDRITGRGAVDMKAGVAVMIALMHELDLSTAGVDLSWVYYPREEVNFADNGLGELLANDRVPTDGDLYLVLEPTNGQFELGCVGSVSADITYIGKAAHAARPWQGQNAITRAGAWLAWMDRLEPSAVEVDWLVFRETYAVTLARGGIAQNVVPDEFVCRVNHRFAPHRALDEATERLREIAPDADRFEVVDAAPAGRPCTENPLVQQLRDAMGLDVLPKQAWTDVARFSEAGLDAANLGPGDNALSHQKDEWISAYALERFHDGLKRSLQ
jgi:succinyl-diaminopimelate desuccinylase